MLKTGRIHDNIKQDTRAVRQREVRAGRDVLAFGPHNKSIFDSVSRR